MKICSPKTFAFCQSTMWRIPTRIEQKPLRNRNSSIAKFTLGYYQQPLTDLAISASFFDTQLKRIKLRKWRPTSEAGSNTKQASTRSDFSIEQRGPDHRMHRPRDSQSLALQGDRWKPRSTRGLSRRLCTTCGAGPGRFRCHRRHAEPSSVHAESTLATPDAGDRHSPTHLSPALRHGTPTASLSGHARRSPHHDHLRT